LPAAAIEALDVAATSIRCGRGSWIAAFLEELIRKEIPALGQAAVPKRETQP
jgi:hypothetical protein